jgi:hypothetical protein
MIIHADVGGNFKIMKQTKTNRLFIILNLALSFIVVIMIMKGLQHIANTQTIAKYHTGDGLGGSILTIQSNKTFIFEAYLDILPNTILRGTWTKLNDTIALNGSRCYNNDNGLIKEKQYCLEFENAKFIMYSDSLVYVSGKSSITNMSKWIE